MATSVAVNQRRVADRKRHDRDRKKRIKGMSRYGRENRAELRERARERYAAHPERGRARQAVKRALKNGTLVRECCAVCGANKSQAHHDDYDRPLDVLWLCQKHHGAWHRVFGPTE